jgi:hypothetical protein
VCTVSWFEKESTVDELEFRFARGEEDEREAVCKLCGRFFAVRAEAAMLYEGEEPLGELCPECVESGPREAAVRARAYAEELRQMADENEVLASRVEAMGSWSGASGARAAGPMKPRRRTGDPRGYKPI